MRDPEQVARAQHAAARLETAWERWRALQGMADTPPQPVVGYVGYALKEPWGQPRAVIGFSADEAERLAEFLEHENSDVVLPSQPLAGNPYPLPPQVLQPVPQLIPQPAVLQPVPQLMPQPAVLQPVPQLSATGPQPVYTPQPSFTPQQATQVAEVPPPPAQRQPAQRQAPASSWPSPQPRAGQQGRAKPARSGAKPAARRRVPATDAGGVPAQAADADAQPGTAAQAAPESVGAENS